MADDIRSSFKLKTVLEILKLEFGNQTKTRVNNEALVMITKVLQIFVAETALRAAAQAELTSEEVVKVEHLEKILPQLLLDFI